MVVAENRRISRQLEEIVLAGVTFSLAIPRSNFVERVRALCVHSYDIDVWHTSRELYICVCLTSSVSFPETGGSITYLQYPIGLTIGISSWILHTRYPSDGQAPASLVLDDIAVPFGSAELEQTPPGSGRLS